MMTNTQREAMQQALNALEISLPAKCADQPDRLYLQERDKHRTAITALRAALAEPVVAPVVEVVWGKETDYKYEFKVLVDLGKDGVPTKLYTTPPPPAEVPLLTDEEAYAIYAQVMQSLFTSIKAKHYWEAAPGLARQFTQAIEQAVRNKVGID